MYSISKIQGLFGLAFVFLLVSCAPPPPTRSAQTFVPDAELSAVKIAREGLALFSRSRYVDAELKFRQVMRLNPNAHNVKFNLAVTLERMGVYEEAAAIYGELLKKEPKSLQYLLALGHLQFSARAFKDARATYEKALAVAFEAGDIATCISIAESISALEFLRGNEEAAFCYSKLVLTLRSETSQVLRHAKLLVAFGRYAEARNFVTNYLEERAVAGDSALLHILALSSFGLGEYERAAEYERSALDAVSFDRKYEAEIHLVLALSEEMLARAGKLQKRDERLENYLKDAISQAQGIPPAGQAVYWPFAMLDVYYALGQDSRWLN